MTRTTLIQRLSRLFSLASCLALLAAVPLWSSCSECAPGTSQDCTCADGRNGRQQCDSTKGSWITCICLNAPPPFDGGPTDQSPDGQTTDQAPPDASPDVLKPPPKIPPETCDPPCQNQGVCEQKVCQCPYNFAGATCDTCKSGYEDYPKCTPSTATDDFPILLEGLPSDLYVHKDGLFWFQHGQAGYHLYRKSLVSQEKLKSLFQQTLTEPAFATLEFTDEQYLSCEAKILARDPTSVCREIPVDGSPAKEFYNVKSSILMTTLHNDVLYMYSDPIPVGAPASADLIRYDRKTQEAITSKLPLCSSPNQMRFYDGGLLLHCIGTYHISASNTGPQIERWINGALLALKPDGQLKETVLTNPQGLLSSVVVGEQLFASSAYWRTAPVGALSRYGLTDKKGQTFLTERGDILSLKSEGDRVYWIETHPHEGLNIAPNRAFIVPFKPARRFFLRSMPHTGGDAATHVDSIHPIVSFALHKGTLYYATYQSEQKLTVIWKKSL